MEALIPIKKAKTVTPETLLSLALANRANVLLLERLRPLRLPQCYITAGCLFQAVWNWRSRMRADESVRDYDIAYFDRYDLSFEAEDAVVRRVDSVTADLGITVEVRNQARVHHWYEERFGLPYSPLESSRDGIDRYLVDCTCIGLNVGSGELYSAGNLEDLKAGVLRPNPRHFAPALFRRKALAYQSRWPWLTIAGDGH